MYEFRELDVRPMLKNGQEPFPIIMDAVAHLEPGQGLKLIASFRPDPLFRVMADKGFDNVVLELEDGDVEVQFTPSVVTEVFTSETTTSPELWPDPSVELDLTDLPPPEPMQRLLTVAETLKPGEVIFAALSREPIFLYPELTRRGHQWVGNFDKEGTTYRVMIRVGGSTHA